MPSEPPEKVFSVPELITKICYKTKVLETVTVTCGGLQTFRVIAVQLLFFPSNRIKLHKSTVKLLRSQKVEKFYFNHDIGIAIALLKMNYEKRNGAQSIYSSV